MCTFIFVRKKIKLICRQLNYNCLNNMYYFFLFHLLNEIISLFHLFHFGSGSVLNISGLNWNVLDSYLVFINLKQNFWFRSCAFIIRPVKDSSKHSHRQTSLQFFLIYWWISSQKFLVYWCLEHSYQYLYSLTST